MNPLSASLLFGAVIAQGGSAVINEKTPVELGVLIACTSSVVVVVWIASARVQKVLNRLDNGDQRMTQIESRLTKVEHKQETLRIRCGESESGG